MKQKTTNLQKFKQWVLSIVICRYISEKYWKVRQKYCKHKNRKWTDSHCGVQLYDCPDCKAQDLMYWN